LTVSKEEALLNELAGASAELHRVADPFGLSTRMVGEPLPIPLAIENQLRLLWVAAFDAFDVVEALHRRVAPSVLAQIRYLAETLGLVIWLLESDKDKRRRSLSFARAEIYDYRNLHSNWDRTNRKKRALAEAKEMQERIESIAEEESIRLVSRPDAKTLSKKSGLGRFAYDVLSDVGSHPGIGAPLIFFAVPGEKRFVMNITSGVLPRAYYLGMAFELFGSIAYNILGGLGLASQQVHVLKLIESQKENLEEVSRLIDARRAPPPETGEASP
jgi:hypothetical protein